MINFDPKKLLHQLRSPPRISCFTWTFILLRVSYRRCTIRPIDNDVPLYYQTLLNNNREYHDIRITRVDPPTTNHKKFTNVCLPSVTTLVDFRNILFYGFDRVNVLTIKYDRQHILKSIPRNGCIQKRYIEI